MFSLSGAGTNSHQLNRSQLLFDLGLWAEKVFGQLLFLVYSEVIKNVPLVAEHVVELPIGGLDGMGVWASHVWERT